jgi:hypothetical protein
MIRFTRARSPLSRVELAGPASVVRFGMVWLDARRGPGVGRASAGS